MNSDYLNCYHCDQLIYFIWPKIIGEDHKCYCGECALKLGLIDGFEYCKKFLFSFGTGIAYFAEFVNGKINIYGEKQYKRKINKKVDRRTSPEYKLFRTLVFERDNYTCRHCFNKGGELNAHHIKPYKDNPELRTEVSNGLTLCVDCHKKEHRRIKIEMV